MGSVNSSMKAVVLLGPQICRNTFSLSCAVLDCSEKTTVDEFGNAILIDGEDAEPETLLRSQDVSSTRIDHRAGCVLSSRLCIVHPIWIGSVSCTNHVIRLHTYLPESSKPGLQDYLLEASVRSAVAESRMLSLRRT